MNKIKNLKLYKSYNYDGQFELALETADDKVEWPNTEIIKDFCNGQTLHYGETDGLVSFFILDKNDREHGPNYRWSSRPSFVNRYVPVYKHCINCSINIFAAAITVEKAKELLDKYYPNQYYIDKEIKGGEIRYCVKAKSK